MLVVLLLMMMIVVLDGYYEWEMEKGCTKKRGCQINCHFLCAIDEEGWWPSTIGSHINPFICPSE